MKKVTTVWRQKGLVFKHESDGGAVIVCHNEGQHQDRMFNATELRALLVLLQEVVEHLDPGPRV